jgi:hypothetical protein
MEPNVKNSIKQGLRAELNTSQYDAVTTTEGPVLVIAGAGSGKTRVIEYRSLYLIQKNIVPESILLLTFTRRSAQEMIERASRNDPRCSKIDGGTFHSFASILACRIPSPYMTKATRKRRSGVAAIKWAMIRTRSFPRRMN